MPTSRNTGARRVLPRATAPLAGALLALLATQEPAQAMQFALDPSSNLSGVALTSFHNASDAIADLFTDPVTVTLKVVYGGPASNCACAFAAPVLTTATVSNVIAALSTRTGSTVQTAEIAPLTARAPSFPTSVTLSTANARALGLLTGTALDGTIYLDDKMAWQFERDSGNTIAPGKVDFARVVQHEINHILGILTGNTPRNLYEMFQYEVSGSKYFSYTGIVNTLTDPRFDTVSDPSDWAASGFVQSALITVGQVADMGPREITALEVLGWDPVPATTFAAVPEPATLALLGTGLLGLALRRRRPAAL